MAQQMSAAVESATALFSAQGLWHREELFVHMRPSQSTSEVTGCWNGLVFCPSELSRCVETSPTPSPLSLHAHATQTTHNTSQNNTTHNKSKSFWPKSVLAKVGFGQSRFGQSRFWPKSAMTDGVGAYDSFSRLFYDSPSTYIWENDVGDVRHVCRGEDGEQRNALMLLLFSLKQHRAIVAVQASLLEDDRLFAFLDDNYVFCAPSRVGEVHLLLQRHLLEQTGTQATPGQDEDLESWRFEAPSCRRFQSKSSRKPPRSRCVERKSHVGPF